MKLGGNMNKYTATVEQHGDELVLLLPPELLTELGWHIGDTIEWTEQGDGSWSLKKKL